VWFEAAPYDPAVEVMTAEHYRGNNITISDEGEADLNVQVLVNMSQTLAH
jgi:hypothetical protein